MVSSDVESLDVAVRLTPLLFQTCKHILSFFLCSVDSASLVNETILVHNILSIFRQYYL